jgi:hypothetical protein
MMHRCPIMPKFHYHVEHVMFHKMGKTGCLDIMSTVESRTEIAGWKKAQQRRLLATYF